MYPGNNTSVYFPKMAAKEREVKKKREKKKRKAETLLSSASNKSKLKVILNYGNQYRRADVLVFNFPSLFRVMKQRKYKTYALLKGTGNEETLQ